MKEKFNDIQNLIGLLERSPAILQSLINNIPEDRLHQRRIEGKWTIAQHVYHLADAEQMIIGRFQIFKKDEAPIFAPYFPAENSDSGLPENPDTLACINAFNTCRKSLVKLIRSFSNDIWSKQAVHPQYEHYDAHILLRHTLLHDHIHMYRIEESWLTKDSYL